MQKQGYDYYQMTLELRKNTKKFLESTSNEEAKLDLPLIEAGIEQAEQILDCIKNNKFFIEAYFCCGVELWTAMDIPWFSVGEVTTWPVELILKDMEEVDELSISRDYCTMVRRWINAVEKKCLPIPNAYIPLLHPCDAVVGLYNHMLQKEEWKDVPFFAPDPPFGESEEDIAYFANELKKLVKFLEKLSGKKLNLNRLREVLENTNKCVKLMWEYNELKRTKPCPVSSFAGESFMYAIQQSPCMIGTKKSVDYCQSLLDFAQKRVEEGVGAVPNEKIRIYWMDWSPTFFEETGLTPWLEKEWNANVVMEYPTTGSFTLIDTTTEESMYRGIAKRALCDAGMIRQARSSSYVLLNELEQVVKDYSIDCVVWPGHMGHREQAAAIGMVRLKCRELGVPLLELESDTFDPRYTTVEQLKEKMSRFFNAMELG